MYMIRKEITKKYNIFTRKKIFLINIFKLEVDEK